MKRLWMISMIVFVLIATGCTPNANHDLLTPTPSLEHTATASPTATASTTPSPVPTLSPDEVQKLVFESLAVTNGGCRLPCLWGLTPGSTSMDTVYAFVRQFGDVQSEDVYVDEDEFEDVGGFALAYRKNRIHTWIRFSYYISEDGGPEQLVLHAFAVEEVDADLPWEAGVMPLYDETIPRQFPYYSLPSILTNYGMPDQVFLVVGRDIIDRPYAWQPMILTVYYAEGNFFIEYEFTRYSQGDQYYGCPRQSRVRVSAGEAGSPPYKSFQKLLTSGYALENVTSMTLEEFYSIFTVPDNTACVYTPMSLWPPQ